MDVSFVRFDDLTPLELHDVLRLRAEVFVVEQRCAFQDVDGRDPGALHVLGREGGELVAYARIVETPSGPQITRVVTSAAVRGTGRGHELMRACLERIGPRASWLNAQDRLRVFYASHGFEPRGDVFLEDDIPHVRMERAANPG